VIKNKTHGTAGNEVHMVRFANANAFGNFFYPRNVIRHVPKGKE